ncbi:MAG: zinc-finger domain-containing protein [Geminicoccaceae bacterium]
MTDTIEIYYVDGDSAACDGGGGALGHPRVYLALDEAGRATCPYCGRVFVRDPKRAGQSETMSQDAAAGLSVPPVSTQY